MSTDYNKFMTNIGLEPADTELMELFHDSTKVMYSTALKRDIRIGAYLYDPRCVLEAGRNRKIYQTSQSVELPAPRRMTMSLDEVFDNRSSCREFSGRPLNSEDLSTLLNALRITRRGYSGEFPDVPMAMRTYPSPGGLYPVEVYVLALNAEDIEQGVYHYDFENHQLERLSDLPLREKLRLMVGDHDSLCINSTSFAFVMTSVLPRSTVKYEGLGYRFALIESGMVGQHLSMAATSEGFGSLFWGSCYDDAIHDLLDIDGVEEVMTNFLWVGSRVVESKVAGSKALGSKEARSKKVGNNAVGGRDADDRGTGDRGTDDRGTDYKETADVGSDASKGDNNGTH